MIIIVRATNWKCNFLYNIIRACHAAKLSCRASVPIAAVFTSMLNSNLSIDVVACSLFSSYHIQLLPPNTRLVVNLQMVVVKYTRKWWGMSGVSIRWAMLSVVMDPFSSPVIIRWENHFLFCHCSSCWRMWENGVCSMSRSPIHTTPNILPFESFPFLLNDGCCHSEWAEEGKTVIVYLRVECALKNALITQNRRNYLRGHKFYLDCTKFEAAQNTFIYRVTPC